jgi:hypothetical protein
MSKHAVIKLTRSPGAPNYVYIFISRIISFGTALLTVNPHVEGTWLRVAEDPDDSCKEYVMETVDEIRNALLQMDCGAVFIEDVHKTAEDF